MFYLFMLFLPNANCHKASNDSNLMDSSLILEQIYDWCEWVFNRTVRLSQKSDPTWLLRPRHLP